MHQQTAWYNGPYGLLNRGTEGSDGARSSIYWESVNKCFSVVLPALSLQCTTTTRFCIGIKVTFVKLMAKIDIKHIV